MRKTTGKQLLEKEAKPEHNSLLGDNRGRVRRVVSLEWFGAYYRLNFLFFPFLCTHLIYLIVPFWFASAAYQASLVEPWFVFCRGAVEPKYPWRDQTSLICRRSLPYFTVPKFSPKFSVTVAESSQ